MQPSIWNRNVWRTGKRLLSSRDKTMRKIMVRVGEFEIKPTTDHYSALVESIIFQQLAGKAADSILGKFKGIYGGKLPAPRLFLNTPKDRIRHVGISQQKYSYIKDLCTRIDGGTLKLDGIDSLTDEEIICMLDEVRGIGRWTAEMFLIFSLGRTNVVPFDDLGLRKAVQKAFSLRELPSREKLAGVSKKWEPYGTIATLYLWRSLTK